MTDLSQFAGHKDTISLVNNEKLKFKSTVIAYKYKTLRNIRRHMCICKTWTHTTKFAETLFEAYIDG